ncbi:hypothetical protein ACSX1A_05560 [Pontibacter sp. MBLB2868]|uniref:hypothetical protein n=1 Tax=Pontibacter sp. MBLB2868 TaxID=3451555 RepID=UPI003F750D44
MNRFLPKHISEALLQKIEEEAIVYTYEYDKHRITLLDPINNKELYFRLPITLPAPGNVLPGAMPVHYIILLIQSGNCAIGYFEGGVNFNHKVFRSYMVRKKQGKSQIKYLKTKGKSRAGSRVRLGETLEFFENINERLQDYFDNHDIHRIAISCSKTLIPYLYNAKVNIPFSKNDPRLYKIPKHIHTPVYEVMLDANRFLQRGELIFDEPQQRFVNDLLSDIGLTGMEEEEEADDDEFYNDDWD